MKQLKNSKIILFNGPAHCGKDSAIDYLLSAGFNLIRKECKDKLHKLTQEFFCVRPEMYWDIYNNRAIKEEPRYCFTISTEKLPELVEVLPELGNYLEGYHELPTEIPLSIREAMIYVSECICKPTFGSRYFGKARALSLTEGNYFVDGSCGFKEELVDLINRVGQDNILLLRIHRDGKTWGGDSRSYIEDAVLHNTVDIENNSTESKYNATVEREVADFLRR